MATISEMGITPEGIKAVCEIYNPTDQLEIFVKISEYLKTLRSKTDELKGR
jgi:hypothetical protein